MKKFLIGIYILIIIGVIAITYHSDFFAKKDSEAITAGEKIYNQQCLVCHSETGKGEGKYAGTALNNQHFLNTVSNQDLYNYIKYGRPDTGMPGYGERIAEKDLQNLVKFIRNWQTETIQLDAPKTIAGDLVNGVEKYNLYCLNCHGEAGAGMAKMGTALSNPEYLKFTTDKQIWISTAYGREDTRMGPSLKGLEGVRQLSKKDITDIVTYIRSIKLEEKVNKDYLKP